MPDVDPPVGAPLERAQRPDDPLPTPPAAVSDNDAATDIAEFSQFVAELQSLTSDASIEIIDIAQYESWRTS